MTNPTDAARLNSLLQFLEQDPENVALLRDALDCAVLAGDNERADILMVKLQDLGEWSNQDRNDRAIALMRSGDAPQAVLLFEELLDERPDDLSLTFNLAWALALTKDFERAKNLLSDDMIAELPQAALLDVQLLHDAGEFEVAAERAHGHIEKHPDYEPLLAAVSVLALDVEDRDLARFCAEKSTNHPDGLASFATLTLEEGDAAQAQAMFKKALSINDQSPRAWIGLGLATMAQGDHDRAGKLIDKGAGLFGDHLGSWIAAGWSYLLSSNHELARERFAHALELDSTFSESHGSLAVINVLDGDIDDAKLKIETAQRLDRACFSAAFANVLIAAGQGDQQRAQRMMELALKQPIGDNGKTLSEAIAQLAR